MSRGRSVSADTGAGPSRCGHPRVRTGCGCSSERGSRRDRGMRSEWRGGDKSKRQEGAVQRSRRCARSPWRPPGTPSETASDSGQLKVAHAHAHARRFAVAPHVLLLIRRLGEGDPPERMSPVGGLPFSPAWGEAFPAWSYRVTKVSVRSTAVARGRTEGIPCGQRRQGGPGSSCLAPPRAHR
jgi:hypothetical protein